MKNLSCAILVILLGLWIVRAESSEQEINKLKYKDGIELEQIINDSTVIVDDGLVHTSIGYAWQINIGGVCTSCAGTIKLFASIDCQNYAEIENIDTTNLDNNLPVDWVGAGLVVIDVANAYYKCTRLEITNTAAEDTTFKVFLAKKEGF